MAATKRPHALGQGWVGSASGLNKWPGPAKVRQGSSINECRTGAGVIGGAAVPGKRVFHVGRMMDVQCIARIGTAVAAHAEIQPPIRVVASERRRAVRQGEPHEVRSAVLDHLSIDEGAAAESGRISIRHKREWRADVAPNGHDRRDLGERKLVIVVAKRV